MKKHTSRLQHFAFVCPRFSDQTTVGGAETLLRRLAEHTAANGHQVTILTTCARDHFTWRNEIPPGEKKFGQVHVVFFPVDENRNVETFLRIQDRISRNIPVSDAEEKAWIDNSVNSPALYDHLRSRPDIYDVIVTGPYLFGVTHAVSRLYPARTLLLPCLHDEPFAYLKITRALFQRTAGILFNSRPEMELARRIYGVSDQRCRVVGMGLDPFTPDPEPFRKRFRVPTPFVLYSGRREPLKGTPLLIAYLQTFRERTSRNVHLVFTGSGPLDIPPGGNTWITDCGVLPENLKRSAMAAATVFCHPSTLESLGIVVLEAWLAQTPVLVNAGSAVLREHCRNANGGLWFRFYPEFEEALLRLLDDPHLRSALAAAGRSYVECRFSWDEIMRRFFDGVADLLQQPALPEVRP